MSNTLKLNVSAATAGRMASNMIALAQKMEAQRDEALKALQFVLNDLNTDLDYETRLIILDAIARATD